MNFRDILQKNKVRITQPRLKLLEVLAMTDRPVTIEDLQKKLADTTINQSTLYRSLKTLVDTGIVYQTDFRTGKAYYEFHHDKHHHHIVCTSCGIIEDIADCAAGSVTRKLVTHSKKFKQITGHTLEFFGLCRRCAK